MARKKANYKYLSFLYSRVSDFLSNEDIAQEDLPDAIVSFCIVVEKVLKVKLHKRNPVLIFETSSVKDDDALSAVALKKEKNIETVKIENIIKRFGIVFRRIFTPDELQALRDIYEVRNCFVHGYKADDEIIFDEENVVKKMGTIWEKISKIAVSLFGRENVKDGKPKKKYTQEELEKVLEEEVRKMITPPRDRFGFGALLTTQPGVSWFEHPYMAGDKCPRCGSPSFSLGDTGNSLTGSPYGTITKLGFLTDSSLYKCKKCNLELTEKQYEIAKRISQ